VIAGESGQRLPVGAWAALVLLAAAFGLALFFNGVHIPLLSAAGVLLVAFLALSLAPGIRPGWQVPRSGAAGWLVAWWVLLAVSLAWSTVVFTSSLYYWWLSALPLTYFGLVLAPSPRSWTRVALGGLTLAGAALAVWALVQFFAFPEAYKFRASGPLLNANNLAGLLNLALLPVAGAFFLAQGRRRQGLLLGLTLLLFAGVVTTQSRGALVGLVVAAAALVLGSRRAPGVTLPRLGLLAAGALAIFLVLDGWAGSDLSQRVETLGSVGSQSSFQTRLAVWEGTWHMVRDHPWLGTGLGTFFLYYPRYRLLADGATGGFYAHMDPLQFWAELGIAGPVLFYLVLIAVLVRTVRAVRAAPPESGLRLRILSPFAGLLAVAVHTHITFHLYVMPILIACAVLLAAWELACERALGAPRARVALPENAHARVWRVLLGAVVVLVILFLGSAGVADRFLKEGRAAVSDGEIQAALRDFHIARALAPASDTPWALGAEIRTAALNHPGLGLSGKDRMALYREAQRMLDRAQRCNPARAALDQARARLYLAAPEAAGGRPEQQAEYAWRRALRKDPRMLKARMALARHYLERGEKGKALALLEDGLRWPYPGAQPLGLYLLTADLRDRLGDRPGAVELARKAMDRLPEGSERLRRALRERYGLDGRGSRGGPEEDGGGAS